MAKAILGSRQRQAKRSRADAAPPPSFLQDRLELTPQTGYSLIGGALWDHCAEAFWPFEDPDAPLVLCRSVDYRPVLRVIRRCRLRRRLELRRTISPRRKRELGVQLCYLDMLLAVFAGFAAAMRDLEDEGL